jgi:hypothetical protein
MHVYAELHSQNNCSITKIFCSSIDNKSLKSPLEVVFGCSLLSFEDTLTCKDVYALFSFHLLIFFAVVVIFSHILLCLLSESLAHALLICHEVEEGLACGLLTCHSYTYSANAVLYLQPINLLSEDIAGNQETRYAKRKRCLACVTILCS